MNIRTAVAAGLIACACFSNAADAAACLARNIKNAKGADTKITIIVPSSEVASLSAVDLSSVGCDTSPPKLKEYRDNICRTASIGNDAVQARIAHVLGAEPAKLCSDANGLLSGSLK